MFKKLLTETKTIHQSYRPLSPSRSTTPSRQNTADPLAVRKDQIIRSPIHNLNQTNKQPPQHINNPLKRKCTSPIRPNIRSPSPLVRKNTQPTPNNRSPLKIQFGFQKLCQDQESRMPQSCCVPSTYMKSTYDKQNLRSNMGLFANLIKQQNNKSQNCTNMRIIKTQKTSVYSAVVKNHESDQKTVNKQNQESFSKNEYPRKDQGSVTTIDCSIGKKLSFKDSLKAMPLSAVPESKETPEVILQKKVDLNDSIGSISKNDRVNESILQSSMMDLNMDPCF